LSGESVKNEAPALEVFHDCGGGFGVAVRRAFGNFTDYVPECGLEPIGPLTSLSRVDSLSTARLIRILQTLAFDDDGPRTRKLGDDRTIDLSIAVMLNKLELWPLERRTCWSGR
jgi:hypothetical protein